jgi:hypothetical protein
MSYDFQEVEGIECRDGIFLIDWPAVRRIVRSYHLWGNINTFTSNKKIEEGGLFSEPVFTLDVDWNSVDRKTPTSTTADLQSHRGQLYSWLMSMSEYKKQLRQYWLWAGGKKKNGIWCGALTRARR